MQAGEYDVPGRNTPSDISDWQEVAVKKQATVGVFVRVQGAVEWMRIDEPGRVGG